jgi:hypothetical protein
LTGVDGSAILASAPYEDTETLSLRGIILRWAFLLRHHLWAGWPLSRWVGLLLVASTLAALIHWWPQFWPAVLLAGLYLLYILVLAWAARQQYIGFKAAISAEALLSDAPCAPPLRVEELVPLRATGRFSVEGKERYYADLEADFESVGTREHIILGRVHPSSFLLVGHWPWEDVGWWYIFFTPAMIREMKVGHLCFGPRPRLTLQVVYAPDDDIEETVYLTFGDEGAMRRVWEDLARDAPIDTGPGLVDE